MKVTKETQAAEVFTPMKFDVVIGNPPYNVTTGNTISGVGGNNQLYRSFVKKMRNLSNEYLSVLCPKSIIRDLLASKAYVFSINLMDEEDYWKYNTLIFVEDTTRSSEGLVFPPTICGKIIGVREWELGEKSCRKKEGKDLAIVALPGRANNFNAQRDFVSRDSCISGPKFSYKILESKRSYLATGELLCTKGVGYVLLSSLEEAQQLKLFVENNKALKFFHKRMKLKGFAYDCMRWTKKFDLSQIKTGFEYPKEFNLTPEEIAYIERIFT